MKKDMKNVFKFLKESAFLTKCDSETIENGSKEQKGGFLDILVGTLAACFLRNMLAGEEVI